jgi:hypothetical protein
MKDIGKYILIWGIGSILFSQFGYELRIFMWTNHWGETIGWRIRGGAIVIGIVLMGIAMKERIEIKKIAMQKEKSEEQPKEQPEEK